MQRTLEILRHWEIPIAILFVYYILAVFVIRFVYHRWCSKRRAVNLRRHRLTFALVLAIVFTPSVISDFWLFMVPGPAILEFLLLSTGILQEPRLVLYLITVVCLLPLMAGFGISYLALWLYDRRRPDAIPSN